MSFKVQISIDRQGLSSCTKDRKEEIRESKDKCYIHISFCPQD